MIVVARRENQNITIAAVTGVTTVAAQEDITTQTIAHSVEALGGYTY